MKITKYDKEAIIRSVMNDVPGIDQVKTRKEMQEAVTKAMSPEVRKLAKTHPKALLQESFGSYQFGLDSYLTLTIGDVDTKEVLKPWIDAYQVRRDAKHQLMNAINSCNTLKQLMDRLPEFERYYPTEAEPTKNLPALLHVVSDLCKLGWPVKRKPAVLADLATA
jgi:hypothetical protein